MIHKSITTANGIHIPVAYEFANSTARNTATDPYTGVAYLATDKYKFSVQSDNNTVWMLTVPATPTWTQVGGIPTDFSISGQTEGDILQFDGSNWVRLGIGTNGQIPKVNSGATALEYTDYKHGFGVLIPDPISAADDLVFVRVPYAMTLAKVRLGNVTKGTGTGSNKAKVKYHATDPSATATIFASETNAPATTSSTFTADSGAPTTTSLAAGGWLSIGFSAVTATTVAAKCVVEFLE